MTLTPSTFRAVWPEFAQQDLYPDAQIQFWLNNAYAYINPSYWDATQLDLGAALYAAHNIVTSFRDQQIALRGGAPGQDVGALANKAIDKISVGYDVNVGALPGGGNWNLTTYGTRFYKMLKQQGMGLFQVSGSDQSGLGSTY